MQNNIYKPRYKIAFLSKSKVWPYKNSRLRRFYNIRGRRLVRRGLFKRYFLVFNNMKWTVARRYIRPYRIRRSSGTVKKRYKTAFYNKQQLRHFYGKFKEETFRNFFRASLVGINNRNNSYYSALERRADMFLFRTRVLPTIYAANQFVHHQGVELNGFLEKSPHALVRPGAVLTFQPKYWNILAEELYVKLEYRLYGNALLLHRTYSRLKKKMRRTIRRNRRKDKKRFFHAKKYLSLRKKIIKKLMPKIKTLKSRNEKNLNLDYLYKIFANNLWKDCQLPKGCSLKIFYEMLDLYMSEVEMEALTNLNLEAYSSTYNKLGLKLWYLLKEVKSSSLKKVKFTTRSYLKKVKIKKGNKGRKEIRSWKKIAAVRKFLKVKKWKQAQATFFKSMLKITNLYKKVLEISMEIKFLEINYRIAFIKSILIRENVLKKLNEKEKYLLIKRFLSFKYSKKVPFVKQWTRNRRFKRQALIKILNNKYIGIKKSRVVKKRLVIRRFKYFWRLRKRKQKKLCKKKLKIKKSKYETTLKFYSKFFRSTRWKLTKIRKTRVGFSWIKEYTGKKSILKSQRKPKIIPLRIRIKRSLKKFRKIKKLDRRNVLIERRKLVVGRIKLLEAKRKNLWPERKNLIKLQKGVRQMIQNYKRRAKRRYTLHSQNKKYFTRKILREAPYMYCHTFWVQKCIRLKKKPNLQKNILQVLKFLNSEEKVSERKSVLIKAKEVLFKYKKYLVTEKQLYFLKMTNFWQSFLTVSKISHKWVKRYYYSSTGGRTKERFLSKKPIYYYIAHKRYRAKRKVSVVRLKSVHWYIPSYIHFDFQTMTAVFLHHPLSKEIVYSFKCSLPKIHAFYRSKGY